MPRELYFAILDYADLLIRSNGERVVDEKFLRAYIASVALFHWAHIPVKLDLTKIKDEPNITKDIVAAISDAVFAVVSGFTKPLVPHIEEVSGMLIPVFEDKILTRNPAVLSRVRRTYDPDTHAELAVGPYYLYLDKKYYKDVNLHQNIVFKCKKPGSIKNHQYYEKADRYDCYLPANIYKCLPIELTDQVASADILRNIAIERSVTCENIDGVK
jgi:hypothetical protein